VRRLPFIAAIALVVGLLAGTAAAAGATSRPHVVEAKGPGFPTKTYVLSLPSRQPLTLNDVTVTENGRAVLHPTLVPASHASKKTFGVVLLLDTSFSMKGRPFAAAVTAAQAFAAVRNPNEQLGLIEYNRETTTKLELTTSAKKITDALVSPPTIKTGTHIYGAVGQAEAMLTAAHIRSGSIVVLSDGQEHGQDTKTLAQVAQAALAAHMRIYTIGLADGTFKPGTLKALASAGHGDYTQAKPEALATLFDKLSRTLSNEYLLQYTSTAEPSVKVSVDVSIKGLGSAPTAGYTSPPLPVNNTRPPTYKPSVASRIWSSAITMIVIALLAAGIVALLVIVALRPKRSGLPARMAEFVSIRGLQRDSGPIGGAVSDAALHERKNFWDRFVETLEIADIKVEPEWIVAGTVAATGLTFLLIYAGTGSPAWGLFALALPYFSREWVVRTLRRRRNRFAEQLPDALQVVASALRSGHSFAGSLAVVVENASEPMKTEMQRVVADEQQGIPIQQTLGVVAERMASRDIEQLALVAELQREAGGNAAEVVDRVAETVRERFDLRRLIQTLTMQGRMSRWIVSGLPVGIVLVLQVENPHYLHPLLASTGGKVVFALAAAWAVAGSFVIKKIVEIEV
jgi:Flp pilus assembly protein TadB/Mg-chelatase subunit ChlD